MVAKPVHPSVANLGRNIFIYNNIQTKQVVYSLTRALNVLPSSPILNNKSLKQLTFVGKKSIPRALRKDIWAPLVSVELPFPAIGLKTFKMMREFKKLHETGYSKDLVMGKTKKEKKKILMDQKGNSIADLAASLEWQIERANKEYDDMKGKKNQPPPVKQDQVIIRWHDIHDAQYAEKWPELVVHHTAERAVRYTAPKAYPVLEAPAGKLKGERLPQREEPVEPLGQS